MYYKNSVTSVISICLVYLFFLSGTLAAQDNPVRKADKRTLDSISLEVPIGKRKDALAIYLAGRTPGDSSLILATLLHEFAKYAGMDGNVSLATTAVSKEIELRRVPRSQVDSIDLARAYKLKSMILKEANLLEEAKNYNSRSFEIIERLMGDDASLEVTRAYSSLLLNRALLATLELDFTLAKIMIDRLKAMPSRDRRKSVNALLPVYEAFVFSSTGKYREARIIYDDFIEQRSLEGDDSSYAFALMELGEILLKQSSYGSALTYFDQALVAFDDRCGGGQHDAYDCRMVVEVQTNKLRLHALAGQYSLADSIYEHTLDMIANGLVELGSYTLSALRLRAAESASLAGHPDRAEERFLLSLLSLMSDTATIGPARLPKLRYNNFKQQEILRDWLLAKFNHYARQTDPAQKELAFKVHEKLDSLLYYSSENSGLTPLQFSGNLEIRRHYEAVLDLADELHRLWSSEPRFRETAFRVVASTKGNALRRRLDGQKIAHSAGLSATDVADREDLRLRASILRARVNDEREGNRLALQDSLVRNAYQLNELDERLKKAHPLFRQALERPLIPDGARFRQTLPDDQAVVDYFIGRRALHVVVLLAEREPAYYRLSLPDNLETMVGAANEGSDFGAVLYKVLLADILNDLPPGVDRLQIIPDGYLWQVAFPALVKDQRYLIEEYAISMAYSVQSLYQSKTAPALRHATTYAGFAWDYSDETQPANPLSVRGRELGPLVYAPREVTAAVELLGGGAYLNDLATRENFIENYASAAIMHCALHGVLDEENPFESALAFYGGGSDEPHVDLLPLGDILALPNISRIELAVLSACHSDNGKVELGEGLNSLARGFRLAGVRSVLASRWEVNDAVGYALLKNYFSNAKEGATLDRALQIAMVDYLHSARPGQTTPRLWAGFVPLGNQASIKHNASPSYIWYAVLTVTGLTVLAIYRKLRSA